MLLWLESCVCVLQYVSIDKPNEDRDGGSRRRWRSISDVLTGMWFVSFYGIYSLVFIVRQTWWHSGLPPGKAALLCLEHQHGWPRIWEGRNSWELSVMRWREGLPQIQDLTPGSEVPVVRKPYLMMDDGGCMRRKGMYWKKTELNLMGWGFVRISGEHVKGCLHSWTHPMPRLHKKLRHLASTRRTSLGFWRQEVDHLILCKLQSWLGEKISRSLVCCKNKIWKLRVLR